MAAAAIRTIPNAASTLKPMRAARRLTAHPPSLEVAARRLPFPLEAFLPLPLPLPFAATAWALVEPAARLAALDPGRELAWEWRAVHVGALGVERARQIDQAPHDAGGADEAGGGGTVPVTGAQERAQADEIEEAKLAEVDDRRWRVLARPPRALPRAIRRYSSRARQSAVARHDRTRPHCATTKGAACWCALIPDSDRVDTRETRRASRDADRGQGGRGIGQESLGSSRRNYTRAFPRVDSLNLVGVESPAWAHHLFRRFRRISRDLTLRNGWS